MRVVIAGGRGSLGRRITAMLSEHGHEVVVLTRRVPSGSHELQWDGKSVGAWSQALSGAVVINLAGELVDRRPTTDNIELLRRSRVESTRALAQASRLSDTPPVVWLQMSTLAIYGDAGEVSLVESSPVASEPPQMAGVAAAWEAAAREIRADRLVVMRTGVVLDPGTPAMDRLVQLARWGLGGRIGSGQQWVSWLHVDDFLGAVRHLIAAPSVSGIVHVTAPEPVRNVEMMASLRVAVGQRIGPPTPRWAVKFGAVFLRTDPALALTGRRALPSVLQDAGFTFQHPTFGDAIHDLVVNSKA